MKLSVVKDDAGSARLQTYVPDFAWISPLEEVGVGFPNLKRLENTNRGTEKMEQ